MEMERVPAAGYPIVGLPVSGFDRRKPWRNIRVLYRLWRSIRLARRIVKEFKPQIAIGVGGYASGPTLKAAQRAGVPTLLQEQNSYAGVTNKLLAAKARAICVAYEGMERFFPADRIELTGNPVRATLLNCTLTQAEAKTRLGFDPERPLILAVGGSLGARTINQSIGAGLATITAGGVQLLWQTGKYGIDNAKAAAESYNDVHVQTFISEMDIAYRAADLVISRAGAGTISELQLLGKATILVPSPNVAEDHQRKNALALAERDAAVMILDVDASAKLADTAAALIKDPERRKQLQDNCAAMALPDSDEKIVDAVCRVLDIK
jgi:UDP-N-acetylglucosamine--N-acetylmuramyl-(pentapeptide) pyrophosphoryl-undecaprenol N-acetylglucosamine transferase